MTKLKKVLSLLVKITRPATRFYLREKTGA